MSPAEKHTQNNGRTEPLSDSLRELLSGGEITPKTAPKKAPKHKTGRPSRNWSDRPLTNYQKSRLSILAKAAYALQQKHGLIDPGITAENWRISESITASGARISEACQSHYRPLRGHFLALSGKTDIDTFNDLTAPADDASRAAIVQALRNELARFAEIPDEHGKPTGAHRAEAYLFSFAQHRGNLTPRTVATIIDTWSPEKIETCVNTLRNRIAAKLGVGKTANRNKSQRR